MALCPDKNIYKLEEFFSIFILSVRKPTFHVIKIHFILLKANGIAPISFTPVPPHNDFADRAVRIVKKSKKNYRRVKLSSYLFLIEIPHYKHRYFTG